MRALPAVAASAVPGIARMTAVAAAIIRTRGIFIRRHLSLLRFSIVVSRDVELPVQAASGPEETSPEALLSQIQPAAVLRYQSTNVARMLPECGIGGS